MQSHEQDKSLLGLVDGHMLSVGRALCEAQGVNMKLDLRWIPCTLQNKGLSFCDLGFLATNSKALFLPTCQ